MLHTIYYFFKWLFTGVSTFDYTLHFGRHPDPRCYAFFRGQGAGFDFKGISGEILINTNMSDHHRELFEKYAELIISHETIHMALLQIGENEATRNLDNIMEAEIVEDFIYPKGGFVWRNMNDAEIIAAILKDDTTPLLALSCKDLATILWGSKEHKFPKDFIEYDYISFHDVREETMDPNTLYRVGDDERLCMFSKKVVSKLNIVMAFYDYIWRNKMRVDKVADTLVRLYDVIDPAMGKNSTLWLGPPGIGKSETVKEAAKRIAKKKKLEFVEYHDDIADEILANPEKYFVYVDIRLTEVEPSDLGGIPFHYTTESGLRTVQFAPLLWARVLNQTAGMLILDELTNVSRPDVLSASFKIFYDRRTGGTKFSDDTMIVSCGNKPEHSSVANELPAPLVSRMGVYNVSSPTVDSWAKYMANVYGEEWDKKTYAFLKKFEDESYLIKLPKDPETLNPYPVPRTWTKLANLMSHGIQDKESLDSLVGGEVGGKLFAFLKVNIDIEDLIKKPAQWKTINIDAKYMSSIMLSTWLTKNKKNTKKAFKLIDEMASDSKEYVTLAATPMNKKNLIDFLTELFIYDKSYRSAFKEIAMDIKAAISTKGSR